MKLIDSYAKPFDCSIITRLVIVVVSLRTRFSEEEEKRTRKDRELYQ
jgi:hypothetical protein